VISVNRLGGRICNKSSFATAKQNAGGTVLARAAMLYSNTTTTPRQTDCRVKPKVFALNEADRNASGMQ
jgi:hypothetical protein